MPSRLIGVRLPSQPVLVETYGGGDAALRLVPGQNPALQLLARYLRSLQSGPVPSSPELADVVVSHLTELIALSLRRPGLPVPDHDARARRSVRAARLSAIKADIDLHLTDPALSASAVAGRHGISPRYLHKLFEDDAWTFSRYVLDRRLDLVRGRLCNPRFAARSISTIATEAGFGDLSYFNRTFRTRFGVTPSEVRAGLTTPRRPRLRPAGSDLSQGLRKHLP
jgi:AraC-like DNA-binding protein